MAEIIPLVNIISQAQEKIKLEYENAGTLGGHESAVKDYVRDVLLDAISQSEPLAQVIFDFKRTFADCLKETMKGCGSSISDIEVYRRALRFYFPNSEIHCVTTIELTGEAPDEQYIKAEGVPPEKPKAEKPAASAKADKPKKEEKPKAAKPEKAKKPKKEKPGSDMIQLSLF